MPLFLVVRLRSGPQWDASRPRKEQSIGRLTRRSWTGSWRRGSSSSAGRSPTSAGSCSPSRRSRTTPSTRPRRLTPGRTHLRTNRRALDDRVDGRRRVAEGRRASARRAGSPVSGVNVDQQPLGAPWPARGARLRRRRGRVPRARGDAPRLVFALRAVLGGHLCQFVVVEASSSPLICDRQDDVAGLLLRLDVLCASTTSSSG